MPCSHTHLTTPPKMSQVCHIIAPPRFVDKFVDYRATILLIQSISNMVTGNEGLLTQFWNIWMHVSENSSIILCVRGPDPRLWLSLTTNQAPVGFSGHAHNPVCSCVDLELRSWKCRKIVRLNLRENSSHNDIPRRTLFTATPLGLRIIVAILDRMVSLHDVEELSDGGQAFEIG